MIQIDDSGWGSLLGGVIIGGYNTETKKYFHSLIPIHFFQKGEFERQLYQGYALWTTLENISKIGRADRIEICRGYVLNEVFRFYNESVLKIFRETKYEIARCEIGDPLQSYLEDKFSQHLIKCGVPKKSEGAHCLSFDDQLKWVKENPKRVKYVKTGWKSWKTKYSKEIKK